MSLGQFPLRCFPPRMRRLNNWRNGRDGCAAPRAGGTLSRGRVGTGFSSTNRSWCWMRFARWWKPTGLGLLDKFDVQMNMYVVAEHHAAGFERGVKCQPEIAALDGGRGFGAGPKISPRILGFRARRFHVQSGRFGYSAQRQIASDLPLVLAVRDHGLGDESDLGMVRGVQKIRAFYVPIAFLIVSMQRGDVDAGVDLAVGRVGGVEDHVASEAAESSPNIGNHQVPDLESGAGMGRVDGITGGSSRCSGGTHEVLLFRGRGVRNFVFRCIGRVG